MFLIVLILSSLFTDIQGSFYTEMSNKLCAGMNVKSCIEKYPEEVKSCKICGLTNGEGISKTIIGGKPVKPPNMYPWVASIKIGRKHYCAAAIISSEYLITAAHCLLKPITADCPSDEQSIGFLMSNYSVTKGSPIEKLIPHPDFDDVLKKHDIGLIKLKNKITCNVNRNPICLPPSNIKFSKGTVFTITGWGRVKTKPEKNARRLQMGSIRLDDWSTCKKEFTYPIEDHTYCLTGVNNQRPCFGDSGGSMFLSRNKKFISVGITSFGIRCKKGIPFVYAAVSKHLSWIRSITSL